jgi:non-ribosomal peptide synthetase component F
VPAVTFPELFEAQVRRTPDARALVCGATAMTFAELDARANRLAHHLIDLGVGPERVVAVLLPRSVEVVVAIVAVWKAGGVYLPVDPDLPAERIELLCRDAAAGCALTSTALTSTAPDGTGPALGGAVPVVLDDPRTAAVVAAGPDHAPADATGRGRCGRPTRRTSSTRRGRPAGRRAWRWSTAAW